MHTKLLVLALATVASAAVPRPRHAGVEQTLSNGPAIEKVWRPKGHNRPTGPCVNTPPLSPHIHGVPTRCDEPVDKPTLDDIAAFKDAVERRGEAAEHKIPTFDDDEDDNGDGLDTKRPTSWGLPARPDSHDVIVPEPMRLEYTAVCTRRTVFGEIQRYHFFVPHGGRWSAVGHHCGFSYLANTQYCLPSNWQCEESDTDLGLRFGVTVAPHCQEKHMLAMIAKVTGGAHAPQACTPGDWAEAEIAFQAGRRIVVPDPRHYGGWMDKPDDNAAGRKPTPGSVFPDAGN